MLLLDGCVKGAAYRKSGHVFRGYWRFYQVREFLVGSGYTEVLTISG
jgi:hypothetical protein